MVNERKVRISANLWDLIHVSFPINIFTNQILALMYQKSLLFLDKSCGESLCHHGDGGPAPQL